MKHREDISRLRSRGPAFRIGLIIALAFVWMAFNWTTDREIEQKSSFDDEVLIEEEVPVTVQKDAPPPKPVVLKAPIIFEPVVEPLPVLRKTPEPILVQKELAVPMNVKVVKKEKAAPQPKKIVIIEEPGDKEPEIFITVAEMPRFIHNPCEKIEKGEALYECAEKAMLEYVYKKMRYPSIARENDIEGLAVVYFVIDEQGKVTAAKILRDPGGGIGKEALRVINSMPDWLPGKTAEPES